MEYDFTNQPDLAQTLAVTCCLKGIPFIFSGLQSLKIKETDRIAALINELKKLGFVLTESGEGKLAWDGELCNQAEKIVIKTYDDHRMAMAFTPAAVFYPISIEHPEVVSKSYPGFWKDIDKQQKSSLVKVDYNLYTGTYSDKWFGKVEISVKSTFPSGSTVTFSNNASRLIAFQISGSFSLLRLIHFA